MAIDVTADPTHLLRIVMAAGGRPAAPASTLPPDPLYESLMAHALQPPLEAVDADLPLLQASTLRENMVLLLEQEPLYARMATSDHQREACLGLLEKVPLPDSVALQLSLLRDTRPVLYRQALGAAWTMLWLYQKRTNARYDLCMAASAGLLHDLGMLHLSPTLSDRRAELGPQERQELHLHPLLVRGLLERHHHYASEVLRAVAEHHECLDGSGYPQSLMGERISPMGRALALSSVVVSLLGDRQRGGELRLSALLRLNQHRYAPELIRQFLALLRPEQDPRSAAVDVLEHAQETLEQAGLVARAWPRHAAGFEGITPERLAALQAVTRQVDLFCRSLSSLGVDRARAAPADSPAAQLLRRQELTLLAREAAWQLRSLARQASRGWNAGPDGLAPAPLRRWLEDAEVLSQRTLPAQLDRRSNDTLPPATHQLHTA